jgi:hypothetical protein
VTQRREAEESPAATGGRAWLDLGLRGAGWLLAGLLGLVFGVYCVLLTPLYWHGWPVPLVLVLVVIGNPLLAIMAYRMTGRVGAAIVAALAWFLPWFMSIQPTAEGDAPLASANAIGMNWVGLATFLVGPFVSAVTVYRIVDASRRCTHRYSSDSMPESLALDRSEAVKEGVTGDHGLEGS